MLTKRSKGFTLVEIIVALAIISIVAMSLLSVVSTNFKFLQMNKQITADAFLMQQEMEALIESKRLAFTNLVQYNNVFENGVNVKLEQLTLTKGTKKLFTLVSDTKLPEFPVPVLLDATAILRKNNALAKQAYVLPTTDVYGTSTLDVNTASNFLTNSYYWYVSRLGFNMPITGNPTEVELSTKYPKFPEDYTMVTSTNSQTLSDVTGLGGRHVVFTATPASKIGKFGKMVISKPVFISGLPVVNANLLVHLDGSMIDPYSGAETVDLSSQRYVKQWIDYSTSAKSAVQATSSAMPTLVENPIAGDFVGRYVSFTSSTYMTVTNPQLNGSALTAYMVVKADALSKVFTHGSTVVKASGEAIGNGWVVIKTAYTGTSSTLTLGQDVTNVAELIVYKNAITPEQDTAIIEYLKRKYIALEDLGIVKSLYSGTDTATLNQVYVPPQVYLAKMEYGPDKYVGVLWTGSVDTSKPGVNILQGRAKSNPTKTCTLTVTVQAPIAVTGLAINPQNMTLKIGQIAGISATITPDNAHDKRLTFTSSDGSVATVDADGTVTAKAVGTTDITVKTMSGNYQKVCRVTVQSEASVYDKLVLHLDANSDLQIEDNKIAQWSDLSSYSNDFTQTTISRRPIYVGGGLKYQPIIHFDSGLKTFLTSGKQSLSGVDFEIDGTQDFTIFIVGKAKNNGLPQTFIGKSGGWGSQATYAMGLAQGQNSLGQSTFGFAQVMRGVLNRNVTTMPTRDFFNLHEVRLAGTNHEYYVNGERKSGHNSIGSAAFQLKNILLGSTNDGATANLDGDLAEIMVFNGALTDDERRAVEKKLMTKWLTKAEFEFNDSLLGWYGPTSGYSEYDGIKNISWSPDGTWRGELNPSPYADIPVIKSPDYSPIAIDDGDTVHIRIASTASRKNTLLSYDYQNTSGILMNKSVEFNVENDGNYHDYYIPIKPINPYTGKQEVFTSIEQLALYPAYNGVPGFNGTGTIKIDFIRIINH